MRKRYGVGLNSRLHRLLATVAVCGVGIVSYSTASAGPVQDAGTASKAASPVEDIYVARSMRVGRSTVPTGFCAESRSGFGNAAFEDQYTFHSTAVRGSDALVTDTNVATVGRLHACLGSQDKSVYGFYVEGALGSVTFTGRGECRTIKPDYPEAGMRETGCFLQLTDLPAGYVGGYLTTSTLGSRAALGDRSDPPGYTQNSIATIRLWKQR